MPSSHLILCPPLLLLPLIPPSIRDFSNDSREDLGVRKGWGKWDVGHRGACTSTLYQYRNPAPPVEKRSRRRAPSREGFKRVILLHGLYLGEEREVGHHPSAECNLATGIWGLSQWISWLKITAKGWSQSRRGPRAQPHYSAELPEGMWGNRKTRRVEIPRPGLLS